MTPRSYRLVTRPEAEEEVREAGAWYESRRRGLGREFRVSTTALRQNPLQHQIVLELAGRVLLRRFPYGVIHEFHRAEAVILACFHEARDPVEWQERVTRNGSEEPSNGKAQRSAPPCLVVPLRVLCVMPALFT